MIIDLHVHTSNGSDDSFITIPNLVNWARQSGLDAVCVTDHDWFWKPETVDQWRQENDFLILPGVEMNTDDGHMLVFGLDHYSFGMHHTEELRRVLDETGGVMIYAHPHRRNLRWDEEIETGVERCAQYKVFDYVDIVETQNGRSTERQNQFSLELCRRLDLKATGGSDAHQLSDIPSGATEFDVEISRVDDLIRELKAGRFRPVDLKPSEPIDRKQLR